MKTSKQPTIAASQPETTDVVTTVNPRERPKAMMQPTNHHSLVFLPTNKIIGPLSIKPPTIPPTNAPTNLTVNTASTSLNPYQQPLGFDDDFSSLDAQENNQQPSNALINVSPSAIQSVSYLHQQTQMSEPSAAINNPEMKKSHRRSASQ